MRITFHRSSDAPGLNGGRGRAPARRVAPVVRRLTSLLLALVTLLTVLGIAWAQQPSAMPMSEREDAQRLLAVVAPLGHFELGHTASDGYTFMLSDAKGEHLGDVSIGLTRGNGPVPRVRSAHYTATIFNTSPDPASVDVLVKAADAVIASDGGPVAEPGMRVSDVEDYHAMILATEVVIAAALLMALWRRGRVTLDLRKHFVIQGCVQGSILVYWSFYWAGVAVQLPMIVLMFVMCYAADAACSFARYGNWRVGLSPVPIVLSTNLFVWLDWRGATMAMVLAVASKTLIQRKGRHVFNPSVAGLTVNAVCTVLFPDFVHFGGLFHTFNLAPNMAEWIFLVSLIPLTVFRLLPVTIGCVIGMVYVTHTSGALRPTLLLLMTLLATDPATTPKTDLGRLFYGFAVGATYPLYSMLLRKLGQPDDFAKILAVPLPNLFVGEFDALADRVRAFARRRGPAVWARVAPGLGALQERMARLGARLVPVPTALLVAVWTVLFIIPLRSEKPQDFEPSLHWDWGTPLVQRDSDGVPRCSSNPVFCEPFSFIGEVRHWLTQKQAPHMGATSARAEEGPVAF